MNVKKTYKEVEDLKVYGMLCELHIQVSDNTKQWPPEERYELGSQVRRSSNSAPSQLAEKNDDRHVRNKIEGVNLARGEAGETIHHLYMALLKGYISRACFDSFRSSYKECIRMLNGLERTLETGIPVKDRRWPAANEERAEYSSNLVPAGYPEPEDNPTAPPET